ncbi:hypothetical protein ACQB60_02750 [Actinomycetota bacterium Odt1-20B]
MDHSRLPLRRRLAFPLMCAIALGCGAFTGAQLAAYHVPVLLLISCALATVSSVLCVLGQAKEALTSVVHRCPADDCDFEVRVSDGDAAESRRWQEIAADHPHHDHAAR